MIDAPIVTKDSSNTPAIYINKFININAFVFNVIATFLKEVITCSYLKTGLISLRKYI
jgi:hypothetical protein